MNIPQAVILNVLGINPILNEAQTSEIRGVLAAEEETIACLDAEIAKTLEQLEKLKKQRNDVERLVYSNLAPTYSEMREITRVIVQKEAELERIQAEIVNAHAVLHSLVHERDKASCVEKAGYEATLYPSTNDVSIEHPSSEHATPLALEQLDAEIERYRAILKRLSSDRDETLAALEVQRAVLSPVRRLPLEVMAEIFMHCLPDDEYVEPRPRDAPLLLTQICSSWKSISYSTPRLWSSIAIEISKNRCHPHPSLMQTWITRSLVSPISFRITEGLILEDLTPDNPLQMTASKILDLFVPLYHRWRSVQLDYSDWRLDTGLSKLAKDTAAPILETLRLTRDFWVREDSEHLLAILSAPRLQEFGWKCRHSRLNPMTVIPLPQITNLHLELFLASEEIFSIFTECPLLVSCELYVIHAPADPTSSPDSDPSDAAPIVAKSLQSLKLKIYTSAKGIFDRLVLPSLRELKIGRAEEALPPAGFWAQEQLQSCLSVSRCSLESLHLSDTDITSTELMELLALLSLSLKQLMISDEWARANCVTDDVLRTLTYRAMPEIPGHDCCLCPRLDFLKLWGCLSSSDGVLADLIESRWNNPSVAQLKMVFLMLRGEANHQVDIARLEELNRQRMGITIIKR